MNYFREKFLASKIDELEEEILDACEEADEYVMEILQLKDKIAGLEEELEGKAGFDYIADRLRGIDFVEEHELRDEILQIITRSKVISFIIDEGQCPLTYKEFTNFKYAANDCDKRVYGDAPLLQEMLRYRALNEYKDNEIEKYNSQKIIDYAWQYAEMVFLDGYTPLYDSNKEIRGLLDRACNFISISHTNEEI